MLLRVWSDAIRHYGMTINKQKWWTTPNSDSYRQENVDTQECSGRKCRDGEEGGTLSLGDRLGQLRGMFQRNMLPIHGGQEIKLSLTTPLLFSLSVLNPSQWIQLPAFLPISSLCVCKCFFFSSVFLAFLYISYPFSISLIKFFLFFLGNLYSTTGLHYFDW